MINDQIEFADVLMLNKKDLVDANQLTQIEGAVRSLNADAKVILTVNGQVELG